MTIGRLPDDVNATSDDVLIQTLSKHLLNMTKELTYLVHLLGEAKVRPGVTTRCRCNGCRHIAKEMADTDLMDGVTDRWWERPIDPNDPTQTESNGW